MLKEEINKHIMSEVPELIEELRVVLANDLHRKIKIIACSNKPLTQQQRDEVADYLKTAHSVGALRIWMHLQKNIKNLFMVHGVPGVQEAMMRVPLGKGDEEEKRLYGKFMDTTALAYELSKNSPCCERSTLQQIYDAENMYLKQFYELCEC